jgi:L-cysteine:1D-myo-inositol 2-amino-2-deoxy-alpha-D-glucopyranoside ligase
MVAYQGEKMSKSLGNLVLVSELVDGGADPRSIRLALLSEHYRTDWEWTDAHLRIANDRLDAWSEWSATAVDGDDGFLGEFRSILADDLNTPAAIAAIDARIGGGVVATTSLVAAIDALLGIRLERPRPE